MPAIVVRVRRALRTDALDRVRATCLGLPETSERPSHGAPTFFVRERRAFVTFHDDHHGDGRLAIWCAAPPGVQATRVEGEPSHVFVPAYVGHRGWIGLRLDRGVPSDEVAGTIEDAYLAVAPAALRDRLGGSGSRGR
jgi:hypothetical protein